MPREAARLVDPSQRRDVGALNSRSRDAGALNSRSRPKFKRQHPPLQQPLQQPQPRQLLPMAQAGLTPLPRQQPLSMACLLSGGSSAQPPAGQLVLHGPAARSFPGESLGRACQVDGHTDTAVFPGSSQALFGASLFLALSVARGV